MLAIERRRLIAESIRSRGVVSVAEMADALGTTEITLRRDLRSMAHEGLLVRTHGGAVLPAALGHEPSYREKAQQAAEEKDAIARLAAGMVRPGDSIVLGPGTTTLALARLLVHSPELTVVTNSLLVAQAFISGNGFTAARGLSTPSPVVAATDRALAGAALHVVVLADHTKIGQETMCQTVPAARVQTLITDSRSDRTELEAIRGAGVDVLVAEVGTGERARSAAS